MSPSAKISSSLARISVPPEWPHLDRPRPRNRVPGRDLDGLLKAAAFDDVESADGLFALDERTICDDGLPVADADGTGPARWGKLVAGVQLPRAWRSSNHGKLSGFAVAVGSGSVWASIFLASQQTNIRNFMVAPLVTQYRAVPSDDERARQKSTLSEWPRPSLTRTWPSYPHGGGRVLRHEPQVAAETPARSNPLPSVLAG